MKQFPKVLRGVLSERNMNQNALSTLSGFDHVKISRLSNGVTRPAVDDLAAILNAFPDSGDKFRLILAHIQDEVPSDTFKLLKIHLSEDHLQDGPPIISEHISPRLQRALRFLLNELADVPSIADVIIDFATAMGWQDVAGPKPRGKIKYPPHKPDRRGTIHSAEKGMSGKALAILKAGHSPSPAPPK